MARLSIRLLGPFETTLDQQAVTGLRSDKVRALLAYLAIEAHGAHRRGKLAGLLWPDWPEQAARASLRRALANLRQVIDDHHASPPFLHVSRQSIQFNPESDVWVDVTSFTHLLEAQGPARESIDRLEQAVELYRADLLEGFSIADSAAFEEWALLTRERLRRLVLDALSHLVDAHQRRGDHERALPFAWRQVELDPWRENAQRQLMRLLALHGQRSAALVQYETCRRLLAEELGVKPGAETTELYVQIRDGTLPLPDVVRPSVLAAEPPAFLSAAEPPAPERPVFVARERELGQLRTFLDMALAGEGRVAFVVGETGSGKTALIQEFARRAQDAHPGLLVATGKCSAHTGIGDSYLPLREVLRMLSGDVEAQWAAGAIGTEHARRLWHAVPQVAQALLEHGPDLIGTLVPAAALLERAVACGSVGVHWQARLEQLEDAKAAGVPGAQQSELFQQYSEVLKAVAGQRPLLLVLDDLQWADSASVNLLFHLGRQLAGQRVLIMGAYRPEDVASGRNGKRHPLQGVMNELQRSLGDISVDLDRAEGRAFVEAMLDSEPNQLGLAFREMLYRQTGGHALFTLELLRGMQERGDILQDKEGRWIEGPSLDWQTLPARVEAVIAERIGRLSEALQQTLRVASVEGELFTAEVVAQAQRADERDVVDQLSGELSKRHRLVVASSLQRQGSRRLSRYRFGHILVQRYLYSTLDPVERGRLHEAVAKELEELHRDKVQTGDVLVFGAHLPPASHLAVPLVRHFEAAGLVEKTAEYLLHAGIRAYMLADCEEALQLLQKGLALVATLPDSVGRVELELRFLLAYNEALEATRPFTDPRFARIYERMQALQDQAEQVPFPLYNSVLWTLNTHYSHRGEHDRCLQVARRLLAVAPQAQDPLFTATAHAAQGWALAPMGEFTAAREHLDHLLDFAQRTPPGGMPFIDRVNVLTSLVVYSWVLWWLGYPEQALRHSQEALASAEELGYPWSPSHAQSAGGAVLHLLRREPESARAKVSSFMQLRAGKGNTFEKAIGELYSGLLQVEAGQSKTGIQRMLKALEAIRATSSQFGWSRHVACLVAAYLKVGQVQAGLSAAAEALAFVEETGERWFEAELRRLRGELLRMNGNEAGAEASFHQAIEVARRQQARSWELRATMSLSHLLQAQGKGGEARQSLAEVYGWFTEGFQTPDLQEARELLNH